MSTETARARPSDFPRDARFRDPLTPPFRDEQGAYHVFSYADVVTVLRNADRAFSQDFSLWVPDDHNPAFDFMWATEAFTNDGQLGRHSVLRGVVEPWFRTRALTTMEPIVRHLARDLVADLIAKGTGTFNLARELAYPLSIRVICTLTGIELDREQWLHDKLDEVHRAVDFATIPRQWDVEAYFWSLVAKRVARPREELLDVLIAAWADTRITDRELMGYLQGFVQAGTETTGTSLVNGFALLAEFDLLDHVRHSLEDAEAMRRVVEEILRFGTPFPVSLRMVLKDVSFSGGYSVAAGSIVNVWFAAANRDEAVNGGVAQADPNTFDPNRWPNRHIGLGYGPH